MKKGDAIPSPLLIGQFSKLSGLSCRMLRFYAEQRILLPAFTNSSTGYRRYLASQLTEAEKLRRLRRAEFSPEEIASLLDGIPPEEWRERVAAQREVLLLKMRALEEALDELSLLEVEFAQEECLLACFAPMRVRSAPFPGEGLPLRPAARAEAARIFGEFDRDAPLLCVYDLQKGRSAATLNVPTEDPDFDSLPGCVSAATLHRGAHETLPATLERLLGWVKSKGYRANGRVMEWYFPWGEEDAVRARVEVAVELDEISTAG